MSNSDGLDSKEGGSMVVWCVCSNYLMFDAGQGGVCLSSWVGSLYLESTGTDPAPKSGRRWLTKRQQGLGGSIMVIGGRG